MRRPQGLKRRAVAGKIGPSGDGIGIAFRREDRPGQDAVRRLGVAGFFVRHRAHKRETIGTLRQPRQVFANLQPGNGGLDRRERPANFGRCSGFHVERVVMTRTAGKIDQDERRGSAFGSVRGLAAAPFREAGPEIQSRRKRRSPPAATRAGGACVREARLSAVGVLCMSAVISSLCVRPPAPVVIASLQPSERQATGIPRILTEDF